MKNIIFKPLMFIVLMSFLLDTSCKKKIEAA